MIVDAVIHAYNFADENLIYPPYSQRFGEGTFAHHRMWSPADSEYILNRDEFVCDFDEENTASAVFGESPVDVAAYHSTPIFDFFRDGLSSVEKGARLKERYPERILFYGAVSLLERKKGLEQLTELATTYGIDGVKFYPAVYVDGQTVATSLASHDIAFPILERVRELGIRNVAVHKALPLGPTTTSAYQLDDVASAAGAFPDLNFQVVHAGIAFTEEMALLMGRMPNVYANLEGTFGYICRKPRAFYESIGLLADWAEGFDRLLFASGCNVAHPAPLIERFKTASMPEDLVTGMGYRQLDEKDKELVLGGNYARLHGLDPRRVPTGDRFAASRDEHTTPWSRIRGKESVRA